MGHSRDRMIELYLISSFIDRKSTGNLRCAATINNATIFDQVTDDTQGIMERSLSLLDNLRTSYHKHW